MHNRSTDDSSSTSSDSSDSDTCRTGRSKTPSPIAEPVELEPTPKRSPMELEPKPKRKKNVKVTKPEEIVIEDGGSASLGGQSDGGSAGSRSKQQHEHEHPQQSRSRADASRYPVELEYLGNPAKRARKVNMNTIF